jgi:cell division protein FtsQ
MRDFASHKYQQKKVKSNRVKVQRKPLDLKKYLVPLKKLLPMLPRLAAVAAVMAVMYVGYRAVSKVTFFKIKNIEVSESKRLSRDEILGIAGIGPGGDLLRVNLKTMGEQLAQNPWVETVRVRRFFPDALSIEITEREPMAVVNMGYIYYMDKKGKIFKVLNKGDRLDYPVVTGFSEEDLKTDPDGTRKSLEATSDLLKILQEKGAFILAEVSEIHYDKGYGFTLFTASDGLTVKVGAGDFSAKIERLSKIYQSLMAQRPTLHYIDLDYNDKIVVKKS